MWLITFKLLKSYNMKSVGEMFTEFMRIFQHLQNKSCVELVTYLKF